MIDVVFIINGLIFIGTGLLAGRYPDVISGYSTMTSAQKRNVDIKGFSVLLRKVCVGTGLFMIGGHYLLKLLGLSQYSRWLLIAGVIAIIFLPIMGRRYNHNIKNHKRRTER